jgi:hypothetical protein
LSFVKSLRREIFFPESQTQPLAGLTLPFDRNFFLRRPDFLSGDPAVALHASLGYTARQFGPALTTPAPM